MYTLYNVRNLVFSLVIFISSLISRMLQREPELRASLEDIVNDLWLIEDTDELISEFEIFPLVSREHLTEEEHSSVLQKMVNGAIAHREDIIA